MIEISTNTNLNKLTVTEMRDVLKRFGAFHTLSNKTKYIERLDLYKSSLTFPWRKDQKKVIDSFRQHKHNIYVMQGVFGAGKSSTLIGMIIQSLMQYRFKAEDVMFISFNISIRNELKRKLRDYGISSKVEVRTFDSIVYEISKAGKYPYIDQPNFTGKRKFVYDLCFDPEFKFKPVFQPIVIFIDEAQDLELTTLTILKHFFPKSKFVFAGDIFQSIQKEPKESVLWHFMKMQDSSDIYRVCFTETPRVPPKNLDTMKKALVQYYPDFTNEINNWVSTNTVSNEDVEWRKLGSYKDMFSDLKNLLGLYKPSETMIIVFSAAITVRGTMGDIARVRRFLCENGIKVNTNHKRMDPNEYFLTTAHSSKGLERDYVIAFSTFPLEKAFVHLSDDIVINILTVALTRAKKKVIMYVPTFVDKYSRVLNYFEDCPKPEQKKIQDNARPLDEYGFSDYIQIEHCVTELIRSGVIRYDTRIKLREYTKPFQFDKVFETQTKVAVPTITDEDRMFVGILIENLITSTWKNCWPGLDVSEELYTNPMYTHISKRLKKAVDAYHVYVRTKPFSVRYQYEGIYEFSKAFTAVSNRLFMTLSDTSVNSLKSYWEKLRPYAISIKPKEDKLEIQSRLQMLLSTGVADATTVDEDGKTVSLYEIKASQDKDWKDDALLQVSCYALMTGKTWSRLHLLNPFRNERITYYFDTKNILSLRKEVTNDVLIWNCNSFMAKTYPHRRDNTELSVNETLFLSVTRDLVSQKIKEACIVNMVSSIKCEIVYDKFVMSGLKKNKDMERDDKYCCESSISEEELLAEVKSILNSNVNKNKVIWSFENIKELSEFKISYISDVCDISNFDEVIESLNYKPIVQIDKPKIDLSEAIIHNLFSLCYMFTKYKFTY